MFKHSFRLALFLPACFAAASLAQFQVNPQVNTGIYAGPGPTSVRYANTYSPENAVSNSTYRTTQGASISGNAYRSGQANLGYSSAANFTDNSSQNTVFNISSKSADTRQGYATTGVYANNGVINGYSPSEQAYRQIPSSMVSPPRPSAAPSSSPYGAVSPPAYGAINAQVGGSIGNPYAQGGYAP